VPIAGSIECREGELEISVASAFYRSYAQPSNRVEGISVAINGLRGATLYEELENLINRATGLAKEKKNGSGAVVTCPYRGRSRDEFTGLLDKKRKLKGLGP
jgi:hypothetical protein